MQSWNNHSILCNGNYIRQFATILSLNKTRDSRSGYFPCHCAGVCRFFNYFHDGLSERIHIMEDFNPVRYSVIQEKNPREIVMLRGCGCNWRRCRFCDYHLDSSPDKDANFKLNEEQLLKVTGIHHRLEVINSGSFVDLDDSTLALIEQVCLKHQINQLHFECHWNHRDVIADFRKRFDALGIDLKIKTGVETFDKLFRECYLNKGIDADTPEEIAEYFDEVCLLQGIPGQTAESMDRDIQIGLSHFERVCVNIMQENKSPIKPDPRVIAIFGEEIYPKYIKDRRIDILMENTAFGVGGVVEHAE